MNTRDASGQTSGVTFCFLAMVASAAAFDLNNFDLWWHLAAGRQIVGGGGIPRVDFLSYTAAGHEWIDHEWLFQSVVYGLHSFGGSTALVVLRMLVITLAAGLVLHFVRRETGLPAASAALLTMPFILAGRGRFLVRPELFTLLFLVLLVTALYRRRARAPGLADLWWIPVLFVPWANLHAGMIAGIVILGMFFGGRVVERLWRGFRGAGEAADDGRPEIWTAFALTVCSAAAGLINPFFYRVYEVPFHLTALIETGLFRNSEWARPAWPYSWLYYTVLAFTAGVVVWQARRRRFEWTMLLPLLFLAAISLRYIRNVALFSFLAPVLLAGLVGRQPTWGPRLRVLHPGLAMAAASALAISFLASSGGLGVDRYWIPVDAVDFIAETRPPGHLINDEITGGYAAWRLGPEVRTFIDGRNEVFADLMRRYRKAEQDQRLWEEMLEEYEVGYALVTYQNPIQEVTLIDPGGGPPRIVRRPFAASHYPRQKWALVYWDDAAMVYVRRSTEARDLIARYESRHVYPETVEHQLENLAAGRANQLKCLEELEQKLRADPGSARARELLLAVRSFPAASRR